MCGKEEDETIEHVLPHCKFLEEERTELAKELKRTIFNMKHVFKMKELDVQKKLGLAIGRVTLGHGLCVFNPLIVFRFMSIQCRYK